MKIKIIAFAIFISQTLICNSVHADLHFGIGVSFGFGKTEEIEEFDRLSDFVDDPSGDILTEFSLRSFVAKEKYRMGLYHKQCSYANALNETTGTAKFRVGLTGIYLSRSIFYNGNLTIFTGCKFGLGKAKIEYDGLGYKGTENSNAFHLEPLLNFQHSLLKNRFIFGYELSIPCLSFYEDFSFSIDNNKFDIERDIIGLLITVNVNYFHK